MATYSATAGKDGNGKQKDLCPACGGVGMVAGMTCEICKGEGLVRREAYYYLMNERHKRIMNQNSERGMTWPIYYTNFYPDIWGPPALVERALYYRSQWRKCEESERMKPNMVRKSPLPRLPSWETNEKEPMWEAPQLDPDRDCCPCCGARKVPLTSSENIKEIFEDFEDMPELEQDEIKLPQKDIVNLEDRKPAPYGCENIGLITCFGRGRGAEMYLERKQKELGRGRGAEVNSVQPEKGIGRGYNRIGRGRAGLTVAAAGGNVGGQIHAPEGSRIVFQDPELRAMFRFGTQLNDAGEYVLKQMLLRNPSALIQQDPQRKHLDLD